MDFAKFFKGVSRVTRTFRIEAGPVRAQGVPAVLVAVTGVVIAAGIANALTKSSDRLPETLREARNLAQALQPGDRARLQS